MLKAKFLPLVSLLLVALVSDLCKGQSSIQPTSTPFFIPPHTRGDAEFAGHGPNVRVDVKLLVKHQNQLWAHVTMKAEETKSDWTTASGSREFLIHKQQAPIGNILSATSAWITYTDTNHGTDLFKGTGPVRQFEIVGDRKGKDAGQHTGVRVHFNPIQISGRSSESEQAGRLYLRWMGVIDNGEGAKSGWPIHHGPYGNIHVQVFDSKNDELLHRVIPGPSKNEWVDLDEKSFGDSIVLHTWSSLDESVSIKLWESDPGPFRSHDTLFFVTIDRRNTTQGTYSVYDSRYTAAADVMALIRERQSASSLPSWYSKLMSQFNPSMPPKVFLKLETK